MISHSVGERRQAQNSIIVTLLFFYGAKERHSPAMKRFGQDWNYIPFVFDFTEFVRSSRWISSPNFLMAVAT